MAPVLGPPDNGAMTSDYDDPYVARLYALLNTWGPDDEFYMDVVLGAGSVLDVGCGTGRLLHRVRDRGHTGRLIGLDPARAMLEHARMRTDIEWVHGDLTTTVWDGAFDAAVMTGHAFQELLTDRETAAALAAVRRALVPGGVFAFETRNPAARAWESWNPGNAVQIRDRDGTPLTQAHEALPPDQEGLVSLTTTFTGPSLALPRRYHGYLRFITADHLDAMLELAGLAVADRFGDWKRAPFTPTSPEIITLARSA
jgi:SAM-dependent methyltransferase